ncbi:MAG: M28 family metallopeptidase [bacterium]
MTRAEIPDWTSMLACLLVAAMSGCSRTEPVREQLAFPPNIPAAYALVDGRSAIERVRNFLAIGQRNSGTAGAENAAVHIRDEMRRMGLNVEIDEFTDDSPDGPRVFRNVIGRVVAGGDRLIVLGSHYDTKSGLGPRFKGANDSGSSTGLLLELASAFAKRPVQGAEIIFAFFDGEECSVAYSKNDGLHGSRRLAGNLVRDGVRGRVKGVIVLDMIGDKELNISLAGNSTRALCSEVLEAAHADGVRQAFRLGRGGVVDDHVPFLDAGMPAVDIIDFSYGSGPGLNDYWHTEEDTIDKLSAESLELVGKVVVRLVDRLVSKDTTLTR